jgi:hypothetical protein
MPEPTYEIEPTNSVHFWNQVKDLPRNPVPDKTGKIKCQLVQRTRGRQRVVECRGACPKGSHECGVVVYGEGNKIGARCKCG